MRRRTQFVDGPGTALPRLVLLAWSAIVLSAIVAAPLAASMARPETWFLYHAFDLFCHQQPERSWQIDGYPLAVCARCFGVYTGVLIAASAGLRLPRKAVIAALALVALTWAAEFGAGVGVSNGVRCLAGLTLGGSIGALALNWPPRTKRQIASPESAAG